MLTAVLLASKIMFTGIVALVPSEANNHLVRVVVPSGCTAHSAAIPSHVTYVMFLMEQWEAAGSTGRVPDFVYRGGANGDIEIGVCVLDEEYLEMSGSFAKTDLCQPTISPFNIEPCESPNPMTIQPFPAVDGQVPIATEDSLQWLLDLEKANPDLKSWIKNDVLQDKPQMHDVALRMNLEHGRLTVGKSSFDLRFAYRYDAGGGCQALAKAAVVTMDDENDPATLTFKSTPFSSSKTAELPLHLSSTDREIVVLIGNEPLKHVKESMGILLGAPPSPQHVNTADHLHLIEKLLALTQNARLITPDELPAGACQNGKSPKVSPAHQAGNGGTCNPTGMPAKDPAGKG